jgi:hypothetical protein
MVRAMAGEGAQFGIMVNGVLPTGSTRMTQGFGESEPEVAGWLARMMDPSLVSPVVAYLSHDSCTEHGQFIIAGGGRVARIVLGETRGVFPTSLSPESVRDAMAEVRGQAPWIFPDGMLEAQHFRRELFLEATGAASHTFDRLSD